jgi:Tfp pilus assembly protein PilO
MHISLRIWVIIAVAAIAAIVAGGWFVGVQPQLASGATTSQTAEGVETQNRATRLKLASLTKAAAKSDVMRAENEELLKAVPTVLKPNTFIRRVSEVAALDDVDVLSVTPGEAVAYTPPASSSGAEAAAAGTPSLALAKTDAMITAANLAVVPVTVVVSGGKGEASQFVHDIQKDERTFAVTGLQFSKADNSTEVTGTLTGFIYTLKR